MTWIFIGMMMVSLAVSHAWWCRVRVISLRQDLFDLRDGVFGVAMRLECFQDPAYRDARRHLNAVARIADTISIPTVVYVLLGQIPERERPRSDNEHLQAAIDDTLERCALRIQRYLLRETFTGRIVAPAVRAIRMTSILEEQIIRWVRRWLVSAGPEYMDEADRRVNLAAN